MDIKKMSSEELEKFSHLDIAYNILKYEKKKLSTVELLKEVCSVLNYEDSEFENLIGDFYTSLNLDKRFLLVDNKWNLAENHAIKIIVDDDMDDDVEEYEDIDEEDPEEVEDEAVIDDTEILEDIDEDLDDDMEDLTILSEEEMDEEENL